MVDIDVGVKVDAAGEICSNEGEESTTTTINPETTAHPTTTTMTTTTTTATTTVAAVDASWTSWGPWGSCSTTCGGGTQSRTRACKVAQFGGSTSICTSTSTESSTQSCNNNCCPVDASWASWGLWDSCSRPCGS